MNYHTIMHDDMRNGDGLRVVLFVSGCSHNCPGCHNPQTHDPNSGKPFTVEQVREIIDYMDKDYTSGLTISGGDPLHENNLDAVSELIDVIRCNCPTKTIWLYTGYIYDNLKKSTDINDMRRVAIIEKCDVVVDGPFIKELADKKYKWAGSTNQKVIHIKH